MNQLASREESGKGKQFRLRISQSVALRIT